MNFLLNTGQSITLQQAKYSIKLRTMMKKLLTYFTILAITALPVQLVSASAESVSMQMKMTQAGMIADDCMHNMSQHSPDSKLAGTCCDVPSDNCQGCNDIPTATSAMTAPVMALIQTSILTTSVSFIDTSLLYGIPQKNLLRPPRTTV